MEFMCDVMYERMRHNKPRHYGGPKFSAELPVDGKLHRAGAAAESRDDEEVGPRIGGEVGTRND